MSISVMDRSHVSAYVAALIVWLPLLAEALRTPTVMAAPPTTPVVPSEASGAVSIEGYGIGLKLPVGWSRVGPDRTPQGVLARFVGPGENKDGRVLDVTLNPAPEGATLASVRDRSAEFYRTQVKDAKVAAPADTSVAGRPGFQLAMTYPDAQGRASSFLERSWLIGNRLYSLRMAALGEQLPQLNGVLNEVAGSVTLDPRITDAPDPANFARLVGQLRSLDLRRVVPQEQYQLFEVREPSAAGPAGAPAGEPTTRVVGFLFLRFEKAKFQNREGWYLRSRRLDQDAEGNKIRTRGWAFVSDDWSFEQWSVTTVRDGKDGKSDTLMEESATRQGQKVALRYKTLTQPTEQSRELTLPTDTLPISVVPAFTVLAAREGRGEFGATVFEPGVGPVNVIMAAGPPVEWGAEKLRVASVVRRLPGQTSGPVLYIDGSGRLLAEMLSEQFVIRGVDKAALLKAYPDATDLK